MPNIESFLYENQNLVVCPACAGALEARTVDIICSNCAATYPVEDGIPLLYTSHDPQQDAGVTDKVRAFYEKDPFPNYDDLDSRESLQSKAGAGMFAKLLDEQIPLGARVLEAGCGTGQLSNFLGMHWNRNMIGADLCLNSLKLANGFRDRCEIANTSFVQMNLFRPPFARESFDVVISNGVLHHTNDPLGGFKSISRLVKPGGFVVIGLYNTIGRLTTDFRRFLFHLSGDRLAFLDAHMRNRTYNERRKRAWFMDQYKHPRESKHSYDEVISQWFEANGFDFLSSIPKIGSGEFTSSERLFEPHDSGTKLSRVLTEVQMLMSGGVDGALFVMIGRRRGSQSSSRENRVTEIRRKEAVSS